jgi:FtsH-binding integral membrane protein
VKSENVCFTELVTSVANIEKQTEKISDHAEYATLSASLERFDREWSQKEAEFIAKNGVKHIDGVKQRAYMTFALALVISIMIIHSTNEGNGTKVGLAVAMVAMLFGVLSIVGFVTLRRYNSWKEARDAYQSGRQKLVDLLEKVKPH